MDNQISNEKLEKYFEVTNKAIQEVENKGFSEKNINSLKIAEDFLDMAKRYFSDAHHFNDERSSLEQIEFFDGINMLEKK